MSVAENITTCREAMGWTKAELAKKVGRSRAAISQWENPKTTPKIRPADIIKLATLFNKPRSMFTVFGGDTVRTTDETNKHAIPFLRWKDLRLVGEVNLLKTLKKQAYLEVSKEVSKNAIAMTIEDDSMAETFQRGDEVIIDPGLLPDDEQDFVLVRLVNGEHLFRRYRPRGNREDGVYDLVAENRRWKTVPIAPEDKAVILGTMVEHRWKRRAR